MKRVLLATLILGTFTSEAQYTGRTGVHYINDGSAFTVRHSSGWSPDRRHGWCRIRVRIDDEADVELRGDQLRIHVLRGAPGRDEGSECNAPLPVSGNIRSFRFQGIEGRGIPRLVQEPASRTSYVAVVNIQDPQGGDEGYTFDFTWEWDRDGGGIFPDRPTTRPVLPPEGGIFGDSDALQDMNTTIAGNGTLDDGTQRYNLTDLSVRVNGDQCRITLVTDRRRRLELSGSVLPDAPRCIINNSNRGSTSANALILFNGTVVSGVNVGGNINGRNFQANFRGR